MIQSGLPEELICTSTGASQTKAELIKPNYSHIGRQPETLSSQYSSHNTDDNPVNSPSQQQEPHPTYIYTCDPLSPKMFKTKLSTIQTTKMKLPKTYFLLKRFLFRDVGSRKNIYPIHHRYLTPQILSQMFRG